MLSNLFAPKEEFRVVVINEFVDVYVGMAMDEHYREVAVGDTGVGTIKKNGDVKVKFDHLKDTPYNRPLEIYFKKETDRYNDFEWTAVPKDTDSKIKKSNIFG